MKLETLIEHYVSMRDQKDEIRKECKDRIAALDNTLQKISAVLLKEFQTRGMTSVASAAGTAFIAKVTSATVADWDAFLADVQDREAWELLEHRCSKLAVEQHLEVHKALPPGINYRAENEIQIRRPTTKMIERKAHEQQLSPV